MQDEQSELASTHFGNTKTYVSQFWNNSTTSVRRYLRSSETGMLTYSITAHQRTPETPSPLVNALRNNPLVDNAMDIREAVIAPAVEVRQLRVVHAH